jgi:hypothetical protein
MNALARFIKYGVEDADRRLAAALAPVRDDTADRYLETSRFVMALERATGRLRDWWLASAAARIKTAAHDSVTCLSPATRYQLLACVLLIAVLSHVSLMLLQGPRPGWYWSVIPAMTAAFALLLLAGAESSRSED